MATTNPFDLLGDNDNDDPLQLIASAPKKTAMAESTQAQLQKPAAKLPSKPLPPSQAVREPSSDTGRGGARGTGRGGGRARGTGRGGFNRDNDGAFGNQGSLEEGDIGKSSERRPFGGLRGPYRGGRRVGFNNGEDRDGERQQRTFERRSGTGRVNEFKREGAGRGNWGTQTEETAQASEEAGDDHGKNWGGEKVPVAEVAVDGNKENRPDEAEEEKEPEDKEMTLEEYEKLLEEKRKALQGIKAETRKVEVDKELQSMQQLSSKKDNDEIFVKLGSDKDKRKGASEKEEKAKKSVSINEFLKPAEGERSYNPGGRGRGRGRGGPKGGYGGGFQSSNIMAPSIEDPGQFPTLSAK